MTHRSHSWIESFDSDGAGGRVLELVYCDGCLIEPDDERAEEPCTAWGGD